MRIGSVRYGASCRRSTARPAIAAARNTPSELKEWLERLTSMDRKMTWGTITYWDPSLTPAPQLESLRAAFPEGPIPDQVVRSVAGLGFACLRRAEAELPPGHRAREPVQQDLEWAHLCLDLLESWCSQGRLEVRRGGQSVPPAELNLAERLSLRPAVRDGVLTLQESLPPPTAKTTALMEALRRELPRAAHRLETPTLDALGQDPARASRELGEVLDQLNLVSNEEDLELLRRIIAAARERPGLKTALGDHLDRLKSISSKAQSLGRLDWNFLEGRRKVDVYRNLIELFPDCADRAFLDQELIPLMLSDELNTAGAAAKLIAELWEDRPNLMEPSLRALTDEPGYRMYDDHYQMLQKAAESGWRPTPGQADWLADKLILPREQSLFRYEGAAENFRRVLKVLAALPPDTVPTMRVEGRALQDYLLERVLDDPEPERADRMYAELPQRVDSYRLMTAVRSLLFGEEGRSPLVGRLETELEGASPRNLSERQQSALSLLASLELTPSQEEHWGDWLQPWLLEPRRDKADLKGTARFAERFRQTTARRRLASGDLEGVRTALQIAYRTPVQRGWQPSTTDRAVDDLLEHLPPGATALVPDLLSRLPAKLEGLPEQRQAEMELLIGLARHDRSLRDQLQGVAVDPGAQTGLAGRYRRLFQEGALNDLMLADLLSEERLALLDEALGGHQDRELWKAFRSGLRAAEPEGPRARLADQLDNGLLRQSVDNLGDDAEAWSRLERLSRMFKDDQAAVRASQVLEKAMDSGVPEEKAWEQALRSHLAGPDDPAPDLRLEREEDAVVVGGVRVPRRRES